MALTIEANLPCLLNDLCTGNTHRESNVGGLEGRVIVCTITCDTDNLAKKTEGLYNNLLIPWRRPGQDLKTGDDLEMLVGAESAEEGSLHDDTSSGVDAALSGDRSSSQDVVPHTHLDGDTDFVASGNGSTYTGAEGIFNTSDGYQGHVAREFLVWNSIRGTEVNTGGGLRLEVLVTECDGPQHSVGIEGGRPRDVVLDVLINRLGLDLRVSVLVVVRVLGSDNVAGALLDEDLRSALEEQTVAAGRKANDDTHGFPVTGEGDLEDDLG